MFLSLPKNGIAGVRYLFQISLSLSILLLLVSCGTKSDMEFFSRQDVDLGYITKIAVVPFENNTPDKFSAERVRDMAITQTLALGIFDVVDKGIVDSALREEAIDLSKTSLNNTDLNRLGQVLGIQVFLLGTVNQAGNMQKGSVAYPQLALTLRLVDVNSGMIIWQASGSENGYSYGKRLLGISTDDEFHITLKLLRRLLSTITDGPEATNADKSVYGNISEGGESQDKTEDIQPIELFEEQPAGEGEDMPVPVEGEEENIDSSL